MSTCRLLLVEDSHDDAYLFTRAASLTCPQVKVVVMTDPLIAKKELQSKDVGKLAPNLIVSDLKMPGATGIEFITWLRTQALFAKTPVILLSSSAQPKDVQKAYAAGANLYMVKPSGFNDYKTLLTEIGKYCADPTFVVNEKFYLKNPGSDV